MSLDTEQQAALERLAEITTEEETGFAHVYIDPADSYPAKPCLVIEDDEDGMWEERMGGGSSLVYWRLHITAFIARADLASAHKLARSMRARLIHRWGDDITLNSHVDRTYWDGGLSVGAYSDPGHDDTVGYIGFDGRYVLVFQNARSYS